MLKEPLSDVIWDLKYRYRLYGKAVDENIEDTWQRVASAIAKPEKMGERRKWRETFYRHLEGYRFLPGGRILAGAGTKHHVTLFNCFVMNIPNDSLKGIFHALKEGALTLQQGGGVGYDFSVLRPQGDRVEKTGLTSSGPVSFMRIWDTTCSILLSTGVRRGAMMGVMRCDHPDIEAFIEAKRDPRELRHFNVSVLVTDAFMKAVKEHAEWPLIFPSHPTDKATPRVYRTVKARELWSKIIRSAYDYAEPGVIFGDTVNRMNNLNYCEQIYATNPCGEIPLPAYGACDLGSINLTQYVIGPFTPKAKINWSGIEEAAAIGTRFLDNVIEVSHYPLNAQRAKAINTRRIGLGVTGLADMFVMLGMRYGSKASVTLAADLMKRIANVTWQTSIELAKEKGPFPEYQLAYTEGEFVKTLSSEIRHQISSYGIRNSHHNTVAPTGTISLLANNVSNGIEPIFRAQYDRHVRMQDDQVQTFSVNDYAYRLWRMLGNEETLPPEFVDAHALLPDDHLAIQAAMQPYIDNAISKTINIPADFPFEQLSDVYEKAHTLGLKGCTIFRPNPTTGSVLEVSKSPVETDHCCQHE